MKSTSLPWVMALWLATPVAAQQIPVSFRDALTLTRQHNQQIRAAEAQVDRSRAARAAERGLYFPSVSASGRLMT